MAQVILLHLQVALDRLCRPVSVVVSAQAEQKPEQEHGDSDDWSFITEVTSARGFFHSLWVTLTDCIISSKWI